MLGTRPGPETARRIAPQRSDLGHRWQRCERDFSRQRGSTNLTGEAHAFIAFISFCKRYSDDDAAILPNRALTSRGSGRGATVDAEAAPPPAGSTDPARGVPSGTARGSRAEARANPTATAPRESRPPLAAHVLRVVLLAAPHSAATLS
jgi:hypothetical protein